MILTLTLMPKIITADAEVEVDVNIDKVNSHLGAGQIGDLF